MRENALQEFVDGLFDGSATGRATFLLQNERIPPEELERIRRLIGVSEETPEE